jgi:hypothetical protein
MSLYTSEIRTYKATSQIKFLFDKADFTHKSFSAHPRPNKWNLLHGDMG